MKAKKKRTGKRVASNDKLERDSNFMTWKSAALLAGELLSDTGPRNYYSMNPSKWFLWAAKTIKGLRSNAAHEPTANNKQGD